MNTNNFKYCILKYRHSPFLEESLNLGVLIYFESNRTFSFKYSRNLSRIKTIYENTPDKVIKEYLRRIDFKLQKFSSAEENIFHKVEVEDFSHFISRNFLPIDGSSLYFSETKYGYGQSLSTKRLEEVIVEKHLIKDIQSAQYSQKEPELAQRFYAPFRTIDLETYKKKKKFFVDYVVTNETGNEFRFDYAWQNGTLNLVKPISFDLKEGKSIAEKAYRNLGKFIDLENEAEENGWRYDLLVGRPSAKNLYKDYDHALALLEKLKNAQIIDESSLTSYSIKAIKALTSEV